MLSQGWLKITVVVTMSLSGFSTSCDFNTMAPSTTARLWMVPHHAIAKIIAGCPNSPPQHKLQIKMLI